MDSQRRQPPIAATAPEPSEEANLSEKKTPNSGLVSLFRHTIVSPIAEFIRKPITLLYSIGYFLFRPLQFVQRYRALYLTPAQNSSEAKSPSKTLEILEYKNLASLFAWTWLSISAIGLFFGGFNLAIEVAKWPVLGSLLTGVAYQVAYFAGVLVIWCLTRIAAGSRMSNEEAMFHAAYYSFVLLFPAMVITLVFMVVYRVGGGVLSLLEQIEPGVGTAYPGSWAQYTGAVLLALFAFVFVWDQLKYYFLAFYLVVFGLTFVHPALSFKWAYSVPVWRYSLVYFGSLITYIAMILVLEKVTGNEAVSIVGLLPLIPLALLID